MKLKKPKSINLVKAVEDFQVTHYPNWVYRQSILIVLTKLQCNMRQQFILTFHVNLCLSI